MARAVERIVPRRRDNRYVISTEKLRRRPRVSRIERASAGRLRARSVHFRVPARARRLYLLTRSKRVKPCKFTYARPSLRVASRCSENGPLVTLTRHKARKMAVELFRWRCQL